VVAHHEPATGRRHSRPFNIEFLVVRNHFLSGSLRRPVPGSRLGHSRLPCPRLPDLSSARRLP
jgi:hypothetical protein